MKTTIIGAYPKVSDGPAGQQLRQAIHRHDRGELDDDGFELAYRTATRRAIGEIEDAGIDVPNDGQLRWDDLLEPFARSWEGVSRGPLERLYDNNTYYRQPVISGPIHTAGTTLVRDFALARSVAARPPKAAVCGPLTFATLADDRHYRSLAARTEAIAEALHDEIASLGRAGAPLVDVEEPALARHPELLPLARDAIDRLASAGVPLALHTYFFPADAVVEALATFPVIQVGIDVRSRGASALERLEGCPKTVVLGVVDARNTRPETEGEVARLVERALHGIPADRLWLAPTAGLEYVPHDVALRKLGTLVRAARRWS